MDDPLYREIILDHWQHPHHAGVVNNPDFSVHCSNPTCGDAISLTGALQKGAISDIAYRADGCAISVAAASILSDYVINRPVSSLLKTAPDELLADLGLAVSPARLNCALLPFQALKSALEET